MVTQKRMRKIVKIDEEKCNGCGDCVPSCAEGAIRIINGKAKLMAENLCDGLGACLGHCPMDAITVEEREAEDFDEVAVEKHLGHKPLPHAAHPGHAAAAHAAPARPTFAPMSGGGCPGSSLRTFAPAAQPAAPAGGCPGARLKSFAPMNAPAGAPGATASTPSRLRQWPVQLALLPVQGPIWQDADVLLAADCVPFAYPDFHATMLEGKTLAIACPKLDETSGYVQKLATIFVNNNIRSITIARMEVPCCGGLLRIVNMAMQAAGRSDIPVKEVIVGIRGAVQ